MASAVSTELFGSRLFMAAYDHDPGATSAVITSADGGTTLKYLDLKDYHHFAVLAKPNVVAAGGLTKVEIVASATTDFSSVTVVKDSGTIAADALADYAFAECSAEEVVALGETLRYIAARLTMATSTDEATVVYVAEPRFQASGTTATTIS